MRTPSCLVRGGLLLFLGGTAGCESTLIALNTDKPTATVPTDSVIVTTPDDTAPPIVTDTGTPVPPGAPRLDVPDAFLNRPDLTLTGQADPDVDVTITATCTGPSSGTVTALADSTGAFSTPAAITAGESCSFVGQVASGPEGNTVSTEACGTEDVIETQGLGNSPVSPADEWTPLPDDGATTHTISGTILPGDVGDWYVVRGTDNVAADLAAGSNQYNFTVFLTQGSGTYTFLVTKGADAAFECPPLPVKGPNGPAIEGYDEYNDFVWSTTFLNGSACGSNSVGLDDCEDMSNSYLIEIVRDPLAEPSCDPYTVSISNG